MEYMDGIISELFDSAEAALCTREDEMVITAMEHEKVPFIGSTVIHYPGGYLEKHWASMGNRWEVINLPGHLIAENNRIIKERADLEALKKMVKGFLRRGFLKAETAGDLPALIPENIHNHFPKALQREIYNSAQVLNHWAIAQFINKEKEAIHIISRQLLENVILRG